jgi:hypothetical protein
MLGSTSSTLVYTALNALNELAGPPGANQQRQQVFADAGAVHMLCTCLKAQAEQGSIKTQQVAAEVLLALAVGNYENQVCTRLALGSRRMLCYLIAASVCYIPAYTAGAASSMRQQTHHLWPPVASIVS